MVMCQAVPVNHLKSEDENKIKWFRDFDDASVANNWDEARKMGISRGQIHSEMLKAANNQQAGISIGRP